MKKTIFLIVLVLLGFLLFYSNQGDSTFSKELSNFAIEDTSIIKKVFFADKHGNSLTITKTNNNKWLVNDKFIARSESVNFMLKTMKDIEVKHPVSNNLHDRIIKNLATSSVKVEIFTNKLNEATKTYYVGGESKDMIGSYMLLENSSRAFVVYIPGFNGFLAPRFTIDGTKVSSDLWRDRTIFSYDTKDIKTIDVINHENPTKSFKINRKDNFYTLIKNKKKYTLKKNQSQEYLHLFKSVKCEGFMNEFSKKDSILESKPYYTIKITDNKNNRDSLIAFHKEAENIEYLEKSGKEIKYDVDRMYAKYNNDLILIQFYIFDKILLRKQNFLLKNN